jgi:hypothetical protein
MISNKKISNKNLSIELQMGRFCLTYLVLITILKNYVPSLIA